MNLTLSELANNSEQLINQGLSNPSPLTVGLIFLGGFLTSLGPCSLSLLPITIAYLAGFQTKQNPFIRSLNFCSGIVLSLILLGTLSGLLGQIYGQVPPFIPGVVAVLAILMGLNLIGLVKIPLPIGPDPNTWAQKAPSAIAPLSAGLAFGLASSPCTTPVLAVLLAWVAETSNPLTGVLLLAAFGLGQVIPLIIAGTAAANIPKLLALRPISSWIPPISGVILLTVGLLTLLSRWT